MKAEIQSLNAQPIQPEGLNGFIDHGTAFPIAHSRGTVATVNGTGQNVVLIWLADHRGGYELLMINVETGETSEFPIPFPSGQDYPYSSILSGKNKFYTHFNSRFVEFDPEKSAFTFVRETALGAAMSMTEDDLGRIWSITYPNSGVVCYDPAKNEFRDYGHVYKQNWLQYQRSVAVDEAGWLYFGVGKTLSQIIALDPDKGKAFPMLREEERCPGSSFIYRNVNGKVYGTPSTKTATDWHEYLRGEARKTGALPERRRKPEITGDQGLFHTVFPDGTKLIECNLTERVIVVEKGNFQKRVEFDYTTEGAGIMAVSAAPDGTICGSVAFPTWFFSYNPKTGEWLRRECYDQWNVVASQEKSLFVGGYMKGFLLEWDTSRPLVPTGKENPDSNPRFLFECDPGINRPHYILSCPAHKTIVLAGTPAYGYTGGGLLFWNRAERKGEFIAHDKIIPHLSTNCMAGPIEDCILGGATTRPGTGGEQKAEQAELYFINIKTKKVEWHEPVLPGAQEFSDMLLGADGLVYGLAGYLPFDPKRMAEGKLFFVFDPVKRKIVHTEDTEPVLGQVHLQQGHRKIIGSQDGRIFILFMNAIVEIYKNPFSLKLLAKLDVKIESGGDIMDGRAYFADGQRLYSYKIPNQE